MTASTDQMCRHCHKRIAFSNNIAGSYWYHVVTQSVYCDLGGIIQAEP